MVHWDDDALGPDEGGDPAADEARWDDAFKENRRRQERVHRAIEERLARGQEIDEAYDGAMLDETAAGLPADPDDPDDPDDDVDDWLDVEEADDEEDGSWRESLDQSYVDTDDEADDDADDAFDGPRQHPLLKSAMDLLQRLHELFAADADPHSTGLMTLSSGAGEAMGGLAQALGSHEEDASGLALVQLKRALRGAEFALGVLAPLRADGVLTPEAFAELRATLDQLRLGILAELTRRRKYRGEEE